MDVRFIGLDFFERKCMFFKGIHWYNEEITHISININITIMEIMKQKLWKQIEKGKKEVFPKNGILWNRYITKMTKHQIDNPIMKKIYTVTFSRNLEFK